MKLIRTQQQNKLNCADESAIILWNQDEHPTITSQRNQPCMLTNSLKNQNSDQQEITKR